jgi:predicted HicB family RNase H-like nuclease
VIILTDRININVGALHKELKMLAVEKETSINALVVEAIEDLLKKYQKGE